MDMEFELPVKTGFTIYSKSGCPNCVKLKTFLKDKNIFFTIINCDEYLIETKEQFLHFIKNMIYQDVRVFPIVLVDGSFIGSYNETLEYIEKTMLTFKENF